MGQVASRYTQKKLTGKYVKLEFESYQRGNYGRLLAYVFVDGKNLNLDLVRQGLSPYYTKYGKSQRYNTEFRTAEKLARKEKLNIWGDPELAKKYLINGMSDEKMRQLFKNLKSRQHKEQRKYSRKDFLMIADYIVGDRYYRDFIQDISASGVFIKTSQKFSVGQSILMTFMSPDNQKPF